MRRICVVTTSRADYGIYRPVLREIENHPALDLVLLITGSHLSRQFGLTVSEIERDGFDTSHRIEMLLSSDSPAGTAKSMGLGMIGCADFYERVRPDLLVALGDRFEMHAAVSASLPFNIPVAHIHGGELTEGAIDDALRHSITKMSHLHFPATDVYAGRIRQMGEEPWRITVSGAPSLDNLKGFQPLDASEIAARFNIVVDEPFLLVTYHPVTRETEQRPEKLEELLKALSTLEQRILFTYPNADAGSREIIQRLESFAAENPQRAQIAISLGTQGYFSILQSAAAMVGNSSSGIIEAASFRLPVVNIGSRQRGRLKPANVIDCEESAADIEAALTQALAPNFRESLANLSNPYGDGHAAERIVARLESVQLDQKLLQKHFQEP